MLDTLTPSSVGPIVYPESDGLPRADNTRQLRWIVVLFGNLAALYRHVGDVFVAGNLYWYPVEGDTGRRIAPDVLVVFGRPKGERGSYRQWEEGNVPVTVVFEVLSPSNNYTEMADKHAFYEEHGVEEYYIYDPEHNRLHIFLRRGEMLVRHRQVNGFVSPRLGIRFDLTGAELVVYGPDEERFLTYEELTEDRNQQRQQRQAAEQRAERAERRAARLAELSRKARRQQATSAELAELEALEEQPGQESP